MRPNTIVEHDKSGLEMVIDALNGLKEERFIEGISNKHHTLNEIADMADMVEAYQKRVNIEARRLVEFSISDAVAVRVKNGMKEEGTRNMLSQWKSRGYIEDSGNGRFRRLPAKAS